MNNVKRLRQQQQQYIKFTLLGVCAREFIMCARLYASVHIHLATVTRLGTVAPPPRRFDPRPSSIK